MTPQESYRQWLASPALDKSEREELLAIENDPKEIEERFFAPLEFGTAGLRGVMQTGLRCMNRHIVRRTTQALAELVVKEGGAKQGVAVCYDTRNNSEAFAREAACVLAANGVAVRIFDGPRPTPELSFAIRRYGCVAGINITASHNPKQYNGYKVYWSDGAQLPPHHADVVARERDKVPVFDGIRLTTAHEAQTRGLWTVMGAETDEAYLDEVFAQSLANEETKKAAKDLKIVYTPFHGCGRELVPRILRRAGFEKILCVEEQMTPDGDFPTVKSPNPENKEGFVLAIALAEKEGADLIIGTDPDADRVGILVRGKDGFIPVSGNQTGVLLLDYIIKARRQTDTMPDKPAFIKTIVTTPMAAAVAERAGVACYDTFTGFKFMAEKIKELEGRGEKFLLAYEESYGYLAGDQARDKDAVVASMLIAEMAAFYAVKGMTLYDAIGALYEEYGQYGEETVNLVMPGKDGIDKMKALMKRLREKPLTEVAGVKTAAMLDYLTGKRRELPDGAVTEIGLSGSDVLCYELSDGTLYLVRPSGTEPKLKVYIMAKADGRQECDRKLTDFRAFAMDKMAQL
ncbi:MAG: phospho-sugar mutase [Oscillospiraceae bacterium]|jgi:phosphoglucomutase|nr:phospho-sugar mutase [Oscillospiraceae bacterium]